MNRMSVSRRNLFGAFLKPLRARGRSGFVAGALTALTLLLTPVAAAVATSIAAAATSLGSSQA